MFKTLGHIAGFTEGSIKYIINQFKEGYQDGLQSAERPADIFGCYKFINFRSVLVIIVSNTYSY